MPSTTGTCYTPGTYRADCACRSQVALMRGDVFPRCSECRRGITWTLVRPIGPLEAPPSGNGFSNVIRSAMGRLLGSSPSS